MRPLDYLIIYLYHSLTIPLIMLVLVFVAVAVALAMLLSMAVIFVVSPVLMSDSALDEQSFDANESDNR